MYFHNVERGMDMENSIKYYLFIYTTGWMKKRMNNEEKNIMNLTLVYFIALIKSVLDDYKKETEGSKYDTVYKDSKIQILIPLNFSASYETAKNTDWCTKNIPQFNLWSSISYLFRILPVDKNYDKIKLTWVTPKNSKDTEWYIACSKYPEIYGKGNPFEIKNGKINWEYELDNINKKILKGDSSNKPESVQRWRQNYLEIKKTMSLISNDAISCIEQHYEQIKNKK